MVKEFLFVGLPFWILLHFREFGDLLRNRPTMFTLLAASAFLAFLITSLKEILTSRGLKESIASVAFFKRNFRRVDRCRHARHARDGR
jgi:hypothetical protein